MKRSLRFNGDCVPLERQCVMPLYESHKIRVHQMNVNKLSVLLRGSELGVR